jgi:hypothetical protein
MAFNLINYNQQMTTMGCKVDHIHLAKNTFSILFQKGTICGSLLIILFDSDYVHIYVNKLIKFHKQQGVGLKLVRMIHITHIGSLGVLVVIFPFPLILSFSGLYCFYS